MGTDEDLVKFTTAMAKDRSMPDWWYPLFESESPRHKVVLARPFAVGIYEVTSKQFAQFLNKTTYVTDAMKVGSDQPLPSDHNDIRVPSDDIPVVRVSWNDAVAFCNWLSAIEGTVYRLPTEAEWEFACRAGYDGWHLPTPGVSTPGEITAMDEIFAYLLQFANVIDWSGAEGKTYPRAGRKAKVECLRSV